MTGEVVEPFGLPHGATTSLLLLAGGWEALSWASPYLGIPAFAVPSLTKVWAALLDVSPMDVVVTLARVLAALAISFVLGVGLSVAMYTSATLDRFAQPLVRLFMAIPVVSWILFAILWFKWVEVRICFVLVTVCGPVFVVNLLDGMRSVSREHRDMMRSFRPTRLDFFLKLILPSILPTVFTAWKINLSLAIRVVTMAELVGAVTGIGHQLSAAQELFSVAAVFAWTIVLIVLLFALEMLMMKFETRLLRWRT